MNKKTYFWLLVIGLMLTLPAYGEGNWKLVEEQDGIKLYFRDYPESSLPEFKGITVIHASMASILAVLLDLPACQQWVHQCEKSFVLDVTNAREETFYQINDMPFVKDRDVILHAKLDYKPDLSEIRFGLIAVPDFCQKNPTEACNKIDPDRYVHVASSEGFYLLQQEADGNVLVTWQQHIDPGGLLPDWLVNSQLKDLPLNTLKGLRTMADKPRYRDARLEAEGEEMQIVYPNPFAKIEK